MTYQTSYRFISHLILVHNAGLWFVDNYILKCNSVNNILFLFNCMYVILSNLETNLKSDEQLGKCFSKILNQYFHYLL